MAASEISPLGFLAGGGEMGKLIRQHNWAAAAGAPARWPQSLRTALGIVLHAKVRRPFVIPYPPCNPSAPFVSA